MVHVEGRDSSYGRPVQQITVELIGRSINPSQIQPEWSDEIMAETNDCQNLFDFNCDIKSNYERFSPGLRSINITQWDRGISNLHIPKLNLEIGKHCFCFFTQFTPQNDCSDKIGSWIPQAFDVNPTNLVAYISGATVKQENLGEYCSNSVTF